MKAFSVLLKPCSVGGALGFTAATQGKSCDLSEPPFAISDVVIMETAISLACYED